MSTQFNHPIRLMVVALLAALLAGSLVAYTPAQAQEAVPPPQCITCHARLYTLHDTGIWYCVAEAAQRCTNCHGGTRRL